jgi:hypothetical protein
VSVVPLWRATRPFPPADLINGMDGFAPSDDLAAWARTSFIDEGAHLQNDDHAHLRHADIGFLWTNVENAKQGRSIVGQAEGGTPQGAMGRWAKARAIAQVHGWFGRVPDFIITIDANYAAICGDAEFCALIEHELYHCAQQRDQFGAPKFKASGEPVWALRGHDVEEFVGVVRRYGAAATGITALVEVANRGPEIAAARISHICGTCQRAA